MEPLPFEQFQGKYSIVEELGRGASGICYHITTKINEQHFVLKKISLHTMESNKINNEIKILNYLSHPNLIKLRQSYLSKEYLYLLFDYNYEKDLQKLIKLRERSKSYFQQSLIWHYLQQMLQALQYLHQKGIIHRDIKPSNIFVNLHSNNLQIGDLGTAKICQPQNYSRIGTPLYLPPQIIKYQSYCQKVDIWSLGATIFHIAALKPPFQNNNFLKLAQIISYEQPQYPSHFSQRLKECIKSMLKKDPRQRSTCRQLLQTYFGSQDGLLLQQSQIKQMCQQQQNQKDNQLDWNVQLLSYHTTQNVQIQKQSHKSILKKKVTETEQQPKILKMCSIKSIIKKSLKEIQTKNDAVMQQNHFKQIQIQEDDTIILQVNPNDFSNFCGYYRESRRPTRVNFDIVSQNSRKVLKLGRKSSLFKNTESNQTPNQSNFKSKHPFMNKENISNKKETSHKRQQSGICHKYKHGQLMSGLRPSKHEKQLQFDRDTTTQIKKPEIVVIDLKPLFLPLDSM